MSRNSTDSPSSAPRCGARRGSGSCRKRGRRDRAAACPISCRDRRARRRRGQLPDIRHAHVVGHLHVQRELQLPGPVRVVDGAHRSRRRHRAAQLARARRRSLGDRETPRCPGCAGTRAPTVAGQQHRSPSPSSLRRAPRPSTAGSLAQQRSLSCGAGVPVALSLDEAGVDREPLQRELLLVSGA